MMGSGQSNVGRGTTTLVLVFVSTVSVVCCWMLPLHGFGLLSWEVLLRPSWCPGCASGFVA